MTPRPTSSAKRCAIYARVSTRDQNPKMQVRELAEYAKRRRFALPYPPFVDYATGATDDRQQLQRVMELARQRKIDVVIVWKYDRFARSTQHLLAALNEFRALGVDFISVTEALDTTTPTGELVFTFLAGIATFERSLIAERVRSGLDRARAEGKHLGRPPLPSSTLERIDELKAQGLSLRQIAAKAGVSFAAAGRHLRARPRSRHGRAGT